MHCTIPDTNEERIWTWQDVITLVHIWNICGYFKYSQLLLVTLQSYVLFDMPMYLST